MSIRYFAVLLVASCALGQAVPSSSKPPLPAHPENPAATTADADTTSKVPPDAPVITVPGVCDAPQAHTKTATPAGKQGCQTVITRAQFEALADALQPNMNLQMKKRLADVYPRMLAMAQEAHKLGLDSDAKYKEIVRFSRLQILSQQLSLRMREEATKVPDAEIEKYYQQNPEAFEQADLVRLFVPKEKQHAPQKADAAAKEATTEDASKQSEAQKADEEAMQKTADDIRKRAVAGEDFDKLQKDAYAAAGIEGAPAPTKIGKLTRSQIPVAQRPVLGLKAGEVSQLFTESNGYYVYKVVSKETKSLNEARNDIRTTLSQQRLQDAMAKYQQGNKATLNEAYFGPAGQGLTPRMGAPASSGPAPARNGQPAAPPANAGKPAPPQAPQH